MLNIDLYFKENQQLILNLVNSEAGRYLLDIPEFERKDFAFRATPNSIHIFKDFVKGKMVSQVFFYNYNRVAELFGIGISAIDILRNSDPEKIIGQDKAYEAFLHYSGLQTKNNYYPQTFLTTDTFSPNADGSGTGRLQSSSVVWATARLGSGVAKADNVTQMLDWLNSGTYYIDRLYHPFDTSSIPDTATISSAFIRYVGTAGTEDADSFSIIVVQSTQANMVSLATGDWGNIGSTSFGSKTAASWNASGNNDITLNASGIANISLTGTSGFGTRGNRDVNDAAPTGHNTLGISSGATMVLSVTYTTPSGATRLQTLALLGIG